MSTIQKTENLELTKYEGITYPLFFNDYTRDMVIIDNSVKEIMDDIADIMRVINTVSTQNIDNLIARLGALETKVDNNATLINSLLTSVDTLNTTVENHRVQLLTIRDALNAINSEIDILKSCCEEVQNTLQEHIMKINQNESDIENIQFQIERMKLDIIGNANDINTLASQLQAIIISKQDKLVAGPGITIEGNVISSNGSVYGIYDDATENLTLG